MGNTSKTTILSLKEILKPLSELNLTSLPSLNLLLDTYPDSIAMDPKILEEVSQLISTLKENQSEIDTSIPTYSKDSDPIEGHSNSVLSQKHSSIITTEHTHRSIHIQTVDATLDKIKALLERPSPYDTDPQNTLVLKPAASDIIFQEPAIHDSFLKEADDFVQKNTIYPKDTNFQTSISHHDEINYENLDLLNQDPQNVLPLTLDKPDRSLYSSRGTSCEQILMNKAHTHESSQTNRRSHQKNVDYSVVNHSQVTQWHTTDGMQTELHMPMMPFVPHRPLKNLTIDINFSFFNENVLSDKFNIHFKGHGLQLKGVIMGHLHWPQILAQFTLSEQNSLQAQGFKALQTALSQSIKADFVQSYLSQDPSHPQEFKFIIGIFEDIKNEPPIDELNALELQPSDALQIKGQALSTSFEKNAGKILSPFEPIGSIDSSHSLNVTTKTLAKIDPTPVHHLELVTPQFYNSGELAIQPREIDIPQASAQPAWDLQYTYLDSTQLPFSLTVQFEGKLYQLNSVIVGQINIPHSMLLGGDHAISQGMGPLPLDVIQGIQADFVQSFIVQDPSQPQKFNFAIGIFEHIESNRLDHSNTHALKFNDWPQIEAMSLLTTDNPHRLGTHDSTDYISSGPVFNLLQNQSPPIGADQVSPPQLDLFNPHHFETSDSDITQLSTQPNGQLQATHIDLTQYPFTLAAQIEGQMYQLNSVIVGQFYAPSSWVLGHDNAYGQEINLLSLNAVQSIKADFVQSFIVQDASQPQKFNFVVGIFEQMGTNSLDHSNTHALTFNDGLQIENHSLSTAEIFHSWGSNDAFAPFSSAHVFKFIQNLNPIIGAVPGSTSQLDLVKPQHFETAPLVIEAGDSNIIQELGPSHLELNPYPDFVKTINLPNSENMRCITGNSKSFEFELNQKAPLALTTQSQKLSFESLQFQHQLMPSSSSTHEFDWTPIIEQIQRKLMQLNLNKSVLENNLKQVELKITQLKKELKLLPQDPDSVHKDSTLTLELSLNKTLSPLKVELEKHQATVKAHKIWDVVLSEGFVKTGKDLLDKYQSLIRCYQDKSSLLNTFQEGTDKRSTLSSIDTEIKINHLEESIKKGELLFENQKTNLNTLESNLESHEKNLIKITLEFNQSIENQKVIDQENTHIHEESHLANENETSDKIENQDPKQVELENYLNSLNGKPGKVEQLEFKLWLLQDEDKDSKVSIHDKLQISVINEMLALIEKQASTSNQIKSSTKKLSELKIDLKLTGNKGDSLFSNWKNKLSTLAVNDETSALRSGFETLESQAKAAKLWETCLLEVYLENQKLMLELQEELFELNQVKLNHLENPNQSSTQPNSNNSAQVETNIWKLRERIKELGNTIKKEENEIESLEEKLTQKESEIEENHSILQQMLERQENNQQELSNTKEEFTPEHKLIDESILSLENELDKYDDNQNEIELLEGKLFFLQPDDVKGQPSTINPNEQAMIKLITQILEIHTSLKTLSSDLQLSYKVLNEEKHSLSEHKFGQYKELVKLLDESPKTQALKKEFESNIPKFESLKSKLIDALSLRSDIHKSLLELNQDLLYNLKDQLAIRESSSADMETRLEGLITNQWQLQEAIKTSAMTLESTVHKITSLENQNNSFSESLNELLLELESLVKDYQHQVDTESPKEIENHIQANPFVQEHDEINNILTPPSQIEGNQKDTGLNFEQQKEVDQGILTQLKGFLESLDIKNGKESIVAKDVLSLDQDILNLSLPSYSHSKSLDYYKESYMFYKKLLGIYEVSSDFYDEMVKNYQEKINVQEERIHKNLEIIHQNKLLLEQQDKTPVNLNLLESGIKECNELIESKRVNQYELSKIVNAYTPDAFFKGSIYQKINFSEVDLRLIKLNFEMNRISSKIAQDYLKDYNHKVHNMLVRLHGFGNKQLKISKEIIEDIQDNKLTKGKFVDLIKSYNLQAKQFTEFRKKVNELKEAYQNKLGQIRGDFDNESGQELIDAIYQGKEIIDIFKQFQRHINEPIKVILTQVKNQNFDLKTGIKNWNKALAFIKEQSNQFKTKISNIDKSHEKFQDYLKTVKADLAKEIMDINADFYENHNLSKQFLLEEKLTVDSFFKEIANEENAQDNAKQLQLHIKLLNDKFESELDFLEKEHNRKEQVKAENYEMAKQQIDALKVEINELTEELNAKKQVLIKARQDQLQESHTEKQLEDDIQLAEEEIELSRNLKIQLESHLNDTQINFVDKQNWLDHCKERFEFFKEKISSYSPELLESLENNQALESNLFIQEEGASVPLEGNANYEDNPSQPDPFFMHSEDHLNLQTLFGTLEI